MNLRQIFNADAPDVVPETKDAKHELSLLDKALLAFAAALAIDLAFIRDRVDSAKTSEDYQKIHEELPNLLEEALKKKAAQKALADSMATFYHNGMVDVNDKLEEADQADAELMDEVQSAGKVPGRILSEELLTDHSLVKQDINDILDRANWAAAATKASIVDEWKGIDAENKPSIAAYFAEDALAENPNVSIASDTQHKMAEGLGEQRELNENIKAYPCQEFYRESPREVWRNWPARFLRGGGTLYPDEDGSADYAEGRMIAPVGDSVWLRISRFGTPFAPFDYRSGMNLRPIALSLSSELGVLNDYKEPPKPVTESFNHNVQFSAAISPALKEVLLGYLGDSFSDASGVIANSKHNPDVLLNSKDLLPDALARCKKCGGIANLAREPEISMGAVACPKCKSPVTQADLMQKNPRTDYSASKEVLLNGAPIGNDNASRDHHTAMRSWTMRGIGEKAALVGNCGNYAEALREAKGGGQIVQLQQTHPTTEWHQALKHNGKYYDAATHSGVEDPKQLGFFKHVNKCEADVKIAPERIVKESVANSLSSVFLPPDKYAQTLKEIEVVCNNRPKEPLPPVGGLFK
jgi:hypothetical protein